MNGVHDMGGMHGFGPIAPEADEPVFHHRWEGRVHALTLATPTPGNNIDAGRHARELIEPAEYLRMTYYERWLDSLAGRVLARGLLTAEELTNGRADPGGARAEQPPRSAEALVAALMGQGSYIREVPDGPAFKPGDAVRALDLNPTGHTRLPRYVRGRTGVIDRHHGAHVFPDSNAHGLGENPKHLYSVRFTAQALWGDAANPADSVYLDLWEPYLERA